MFDLGPEIRSDFAVAELKEWLVTNGIGGFAMGTAAGTHTRGYHGLLIAAMKPPLGRRLLVAKLDNVWIQNIGKFKHTNSRSLFKDMFKSKYPANAPGCRYSCINCCCQLCDIAT